MSKAARKNTSVFNWKKYERKASVRLRPKTKKNKQPKKSFHSPLSLGISALCFLLILILIGKLFGFLGSFSTNIGTQPKIHSWDGNSPFNIVVQADEVYLLSYASSNKSLTIFKFPKDLDLDVPYSFGRWPVRSIFDLGQAEKPPIGAKLLKDSIDTTFNILSDGYLVFNDSSTNLPNLIESERKNILPGIDLLSKTKTDLGLTEFLQIWWAIKEVRTDKINSIDLATTDLTKWLLLPDGSRAIIMDQVKLDMFEEGRFENENIKKEGLSIGILNATDFPGLAEQAAKILTNLGGRVVFTSNAPDKIGKSTILAKKSYSTDYFSKMLHLDCRSSCSAEDSSLDTSRADITITLGEDSFLKYQK